MWYPTNASPRPTPRRMKSGKSLLEDLLVGAAIGGSLPLSNKEMMNEEHT